MSMEVHGPIGTINSLVLVVWVSGPNSTGTLIFFLPIVLDVGRLPRFAYEHGV